MRLTLLFVLFVPFVGFGAVGAAAQPADEFILYHQPWWTQPTTLYRVSSTGAVRASLAVLPGGFGVAAIVSAADNTAYRVIGSFISPSVGAIFGVDAGGRVTTLFHGAPLGIPRDMVRNSDGDWIVLNRSSSVNQTEILRIRSGQATLISTIRHFDGHGVAIDESTGLLVVGAHWGNPIKSGYFHLDPTNGAITTFSLHPTTIHMSYGSRRPRYDGPTGGLIDMTFGNMATFLLRAERGSNITTLSRLPLPGIPVEMSDAGQRSGADYHVLVMRQTTPFRFDIVGARANGDWLKSGTIAGITPERTTTLLRVGGRHLAWLMQTPPNGRLLRLSFPGEAGRSYAVGLSLTGTRPGVPIPDGRRVPLVPDALTFLCASGGVPGILEDTIGTLDTRGAAVVKVDTNPFGGALKGVVVWATALVLDPQASAGVAWIVGPSRLELR